MIAKFNLVLFRGYSLIKSQKLEKNNPLFYSIDNLGYKINSEYHKKKSFINFPKENFNFFNSINSGNFRLFKLSRCIKV